MVDRRPQDFPGGEPDGVSDNTVALQAAIDAWQPGDQVVLTGGQFRTTQHLTIPQDGLVLRGDAAIRVKAAFGESVMLEITGQGVVIDGDGLVLDQADVVTSGDSIRALGSAGLEIRGLISRGTQNAFLMLGDGASDVLIAGCDHLGKGYGVCAPDTQGIARVTIRDCSFEHPGTGSPGDGVQFNCRTHGASEVAVVGCTARGYIGEALAQGMGFGFARVTDGRIIGCRAEGTEGDAFHFERHSHRWLCADLVARDVGIPNPVGGNGSGLIAYDCDDVTVVLTTVQNASYHGIALSGQGNGAEIPSAQRLNGVIERCSIDSTGRDGIHLTAQRNFRVERNWLRDPSTAQPGAYAALHVGQQGGTPLENADGVGAGNTIVLSGASSPLGGVIVRPNSANVVIDGISGSQPWSDGTFWSDGTGWLDAA